MTIEITPDLRTAFDKNRAAIEKASVECAPCKGTGGLFASCPDCDGDGYFAPSGCGPYFDAERETCDLCGGTGEAETECPECEGNGEVERDAA